MLKTVLLIFCFGVLCHCREEQKQIGKEIIHDSTNIGSTVILTNVPVKQIADSLRDKNHFYYLSDLSTRTIGEFILTDSIRASDNDVSYRCLDALTSTDSATREFYFSVFQKIISDADGALSETIGYYSKKYIETNPTEFASRAASFSKKQFDIWTFQTAEHVLLEMEEKGMADGNFWTSKILESCLNCDEKKLNTIKKFSKRLEEVISDNREQ